jgi:hypothetical protein
MPTMYKFLFVSMFLLYLNVSYTQIPNAGFENWTGDVPTGWATSNAPPVYTNVTSTTDAHTGTYAVRGDVVSIAMTTIEPAIQSGPSGEGFAYDQKPAYFNGYYKFFPQSGDRFGINVELFKGGINGTLVAIAAAAPSTAYSNYTQFSVPFSYQTSDTPDTCIIQILIAAPASGGWVHAGSYFILDDISFSGTTAVETNREDLPTTTELKQNYPNPFNPATNFEFQVANHGFVSLKIYDVLGREIATLVNEEKQPGTYTVPWDASSQPSGVYFYTLQSGNILQTKQMLLIK